MRLLARLEDFPQVKIGHFTSRSSGMHGLQVCRKSALHYTDLDIVGRVLTPMQEARRENGCPALVRMREWE